MLRIKELIYSLYNRKLFNTRSFCNFLIIVTCLVMPIITVHLLLVGSTHNGVLNGTRYFHCPRGHAALVPYTDVRRLNPPETRPPVSGNYMFESYHDVVKTRALRRQKME